MGGLFSAFAAHFGGEWWLQRQPFTPQQLNDYQDCTFFTRQDIVRLYRRFYSLNPSKVKDFSRREVNFKVVRFQIPSNMHGARPEIVTLSFEEVERMPELRVRAFARK
jgi:hypothetical protein